jgi:putative ABC transport system permease protein
MNVISRGIRNTSRNVIRTFSIVIILGLSVGLALTMLVAHQTVNKKINTVKSTVGNTISISPAGIRGFEGGGSLLTTTELAKVSKLQHVVGVTETLSARLTSSDTSLSSPIQAGSFGRGQATINQQSDSSSSSTSTSGGGGGFGGGSFNPADIVIPVTALGTTNTSTLDLTDGGGTVTITSGQQIDGSGSGNVAIIGSSLASKNNLKVGSTFTVYGTNVTVEGIFSAGNTFSDAELIMPLATVQKLASESGQVSDATATIDSVDNLTSTTSAITSTLGSSADVVNSQTTAEAAVQPLESIKSISVYSLVGAVIAGSVIILLTMIMIVRERRREIGVIKAIGGSNVSIMLQFAAEAVSLTIIGGVIGLIIGVVGSGPVTNLLVTNSSTSTTTTTSVSGRPGGGGFGGGGAGGGGFSRHFTNNGAVNDVKNLHAVVGWDIILYSFAAAILIALIGSLVASWLIARVRPAEVMRIE